MDEIIANPEHALIFAYVPAISRTALTALIALDSRLGDIVRSTSEALIGQMRLTWWHEALTRLDDGAAAAEPVLQALATHVIPRGVSGAQLAAMIDGWEILIAGALDDPALLTHARLRGAGLFGAAATVLGARGDPVAVAGEGWALADLARHMSDRTVAMRALALARPLLDQAAAVHWSRAGRALGALTHLARRDLVTPLGMALPIGAPLRVMRIFWHHISGY